MALRGGAIYSGYLKPLEIINTTLSGNFADEYGGAIFSGSSSVTINNSIIANNSATGGGAGIYRSNVAANLKNIIVANNIGSNCNDINSSFGFNIDSDGTCQLNAVGDQSNVNPVLGTLQDNGGTTLTHAIALGSPAINAGASSGCPDTDQRGINRSQGAGCDIGAYEFVFTPLPTPTPNSQACSSPNWLILIYMNGDNNLAPWMSNLFNNLEQATGNSCLQILALWDGNGDGDTVLYQVLYDTAINTLANYTDGVNRWPQGELNMGDPQTLTDFITQMRNDFPSEHVMLSVVDHGNGWSSAAAPRGYAHTGMSFDDYSDGDYLSTAALENVFNEVTDNGTNPLDVVFYDVCLMAMVENVYPLRNTVKYLVAGENESFTSYPYDTYLNGVGQNTEPRDLAVMIADQYFESLNNYPRTMSVFDLSNLDAVAQTVDQFAIVLDANLDTYETEILASFDIAQKFDSNVDLAINEADSYVDLWHFAQLLQQNIFDPQIQDASQAVIDALSSAIIRERHESDWYMGHYWDLDHAKGLSIYLPLGEVNTTLFGLYNANELSFLADTAWEDFVLDIVNAAQPPNNDGDPIDPDNRPGPLDATNHVFLPIIVH